jgi:uncharacterized protein YhaN
MPDTTVEPPPGGRYPADMESRVAVLEQIARTTVASLERIERHFDAVDRRFDAIDRRFDAIDRRFETRDGQHASHFDTLDRRIDGLALEHRRDTRWVLGIMLGGFGAMLGVMAHGFHWL